MTLNRIKTMASAIHSFQHKNNSLRFYKYTLEGKAPLPFVVLPTNNIRLLKIHNYVGSYNTKFTLSDDKEYDICWPTRHTTWWHGKEVIESWNAETEELLNNLIEIVGNTGIKQKSSKDSDVLKFEFSLRKV